MNSSFFLHWYVASYLMLGGVTQNCFLQSTRTAPKTPANSLHTQPPSPTEQLDRDITTSEDVHYICAGFIWTDVKKYWHVIILFNCLKHIFIISYIQRHTHTLSGFCACVCRIHDLPADVGKSRRYPLWNSPHISRLSLEDQKGITSQYILLSRKPDACSSVHAHTLKAHQPKRLWIINVNNNQYCMSA